jgi:multidrug efflux pump subunit AcrA (membrane-fusion protein)
MENLYAKIAVEETLVDRISLNQTAAIHTDNSPGKAFRGKISEIGRYAEFATQRDVTRGWQDIRTFKVKVKVEDPGRHLKPGMTVEVEIPLQGAQ